MTVLVGGAALALMEAQQSPMAYLSTVIARVGGTTFSLGKGNAGNLSKTIMHVTSKVFFGLVVTILASNAIVIFIVVDNNPHRRVNLSKDGTKDYYVGE